MLGGEGEEEYPDGAVCWKGRGMNREGGGEG